MKNFAIKFMLMLIVLMVSELANPIQTSLIIPFTQSIARICASLIQLYDPTVIFRGIEIIDAKSGFAVSIQAGCNGIEAAIVLIAAMFAFPAPWRMKVIGIIVGFISVQILNIVRIISLFYLGQWNITIFDWAHLYIWQALIMLDVLIVFLVWLKYAIPLIKA